MDKFVQAKKEFHRSFFNFIFENATITQSCYNVPPQKKNLKSSAEIMSSSLVFVCTRLKSASKVSWIHVDFLKRLKTTCKLDDR